MINRVEDRRQAVDIERPDPEVQAGRSLRRLRLSQGWSQEEVARRMQAYGYDFHQTAIAKIEAAQRPLRVRELADFAALYGMEVQDLIQSPSGSLEEIDQEIAEVRAQWEVTGRNQEAAARDCRAARAALAAAEERYQSYAREVALLGERLRFLRKEREKFPAHQDLAESHTADSLKPNPTAATTPAEFVEALRRFRTWAGDPSYRTMARLADAAPNTLLAAMRSDDLPRLRVVEAIIRGCGGTDEDRTAFVMAWQRLAPGFSRGLARHLRQRPAPEPPPDVGAVTRQVPGAGGLPGI